MKAILFVILNVSVCFPRGSVGVEILIPEGVGGSNETNFPGSLSLAMTPPCNKPLIFTLSALRKNQRHMHVVRVQHCTGDRPYAILSIRS